MREGRRPSARPEPAAPQGEELEFLDDTEHALMPALRRAGGWIAILPRTDRWRTLAFYRVADEKDLGAGIRCARIASYRRNLSTSNPAATTR